jgi:uncharacterized small protein (DUF1192 family)
MADDRIKILEERLTRLEATLAQRPSGGGGFTPPGGVIVDSAPWAASQFQFARPMPSPVVDPAPWPYWGGWPRPWPWPTPVVDPGPFPHPVVDPAPWRSHIVDPAVFAQSAAASLGRIGRIADPPPPDLSRLSIQQLEATIHSISAERARLDAMEEMVKKQIDALKKQPG